MLSRPAILLAGTSWSRSQAMAEASPATFGVSGSGASRGILFRGYCGFQIVVSDQQFLEFLPSLALRRVGQFHWHQVPASKQFSDLRMVVKRQQHLAFYACEPFFQFDEVLLGEIV